MMLKYKSCLTSGTQHLLPNSEIPLQLNSAPDGRCIVHNCKNDCAKWRTHGGFWAIEIQNYADANMTYQFHEAVKWVYQCWEFATGSPQNCKCGANFFIADFRHANLVFATCALRAQLSFLRIVRNRKRQKCTGDHFRKFPIKLVSAQ